MDKPPNGHPPRKLSQEEIEFFIAAYTAIAESKVSLSGVGHDDRAPEAVRETKDAIVEACNQTDLPLESVLHAWKLAGLLPE